MSDQASFIRDMQKNAQVCIDRHQHEYENQLDFSVESLKVIDAILEDAADVYDDLPPQSQKGLVIACGSYVFEVARTNFGGTYFWYDQLDQPILVTGLPDFEISITAFEKVKGRLEKGAEDNIPFYFDGYMQRVKNAKKGDKAYIV